MPIVCGSVLVIGFVAACANGADRYNQLFESWQKAQRDLQSLVVEFTRESKDLGFHERQEFESVFQLLHMPQGELFASYQLTEKKPKDNKGERFSGLLNNGLVYILDHDKKMAIRFEPTDRDLREFLEKYFNPFVLLLDREQAEEKCKLKVVGQDEWYTYLTVKPKQVKWYGSLPDFHWGGAAFMNKASDGVPKDMPKQLRYTDAIREHVFEIKTWRLNAAKAPKLEDFARPEDRPGWQVGEWAFKPAKE